MKRHLSLLCIILSFVLAVGSAYGYKPGSEYSEDPADIQISGNLQFQTDLFASGYAEGSTTIASSVTPLTSANIAFGLVRFENGSPGARQIPDGSKGKVVTFELIANPSYIIADTGPVVMVKTGWTSITFDDARDRITLAWLDDATGWIITSNNGCTIVP